MREIFASRLATTTILSGVLAAVLAFPAHAADVTKQRLENADAEPQNWITTFQNYSSHRYSRLSEINQNNVKNMKVAFTVPLTTALVGRPNVQLENAPLVDDGFMYFDDAGGVFYKIDVRPGNKFVPVWRTDASLSKDEQARTRGLAMWGNSVYLGMTDGRVVAVDRTSGDIKFDLQIARKPHPKGSNLNVEREGMTQAPLAVEGKILVANAKGDSGTNGWLEAIDAVTGKEIWRTYTVPGPGEPGHETWKDDHNAWKTGGASLWTTGSYDVAQRLVIEGAAQPVPMFDPEFRPGDNLYSNSALAFDIDTGKIKWFFQYTPNESWDYDAQGVHMLIDADFKGQAGKKMVLHFDRNGFAYQLDRTTGQFLNAVLYLDKANWTAGIDPKTGKPVEYDPSKAIQTYIPATRWARADTVAKTACPPLEGGLRWQPPAYNPVKHLAYSGGEDGCNTKQIVPVISRGPGGNIVDDAPGGRTGGKPGTSTNNGTLHGLLTILDVTTGNLKARMPLPHSNRSGMLSTAGGLVFTANIDGSITAHNDETLAELWRFETGTAIKAPPMSYAIGNKQFIAVMVGAPGAGGADWPELKDQLPAAMLYVFSL